MQVTQVLPQTSEVFAFRSLQQQKFAAAKLLSRKVPLDMGLPWHGNFRSEQLEISRALVPSPGLQASHAGENLEGRVPPNHGGSENMDGTCHVLQALRSPTLARLRLQRLQGAPSSVAGCMKKP